MFKNVGMYQPNKEKWQHCILSSQQFSSCCYEWKLVAAVLEKTALVSVGVELIFLKSTHFLHATILTGLFVSESQKTISNNHKRILENSIEPDRKTRMKRNFGVKLIFLMNLWLNWPIDGTIFKEF